MESVLIKEEWKWIPYFEGYYKISTFGRIMSYMNNKRRATISQCCNNKYCKNKNIYKNYIFSFKEIKEAN